MGNASDTSAVFVSTISKEQDIFMGSVYSAFCKSEWKCAPPLQMHTDLCEISSLSPRRFTVPHGQQHPATCCVPQALDLEAGRVLHHQPLHQRPWDDALSVPTGHTVRLCTQVLYVCTHPPLCLFCFIFWEKKKTQIHFSVRNLSAANSRWWQNEMKSRRIKVDFACQ